MSNIKKAPFGHPAVDDKGFFTSPWVEYWAFIDNINDKVDKLTTYTPGNLVRITASGNIEDAEKVAGLEGIAVYDSLGGTAAGAAGAWTDMPYDTDTRKDSNFHHNDPASSNPIDIVCDFNGSVRMSMYGTLQLATYVDTTQVCVKGTKYSTLKGMEDISQLVTYMTFRAASQYMTYTVTQSVSVTSGNILRTAISAVSGSSTIKTVALATGVIVERES